MNNFGKDHPCKFFLNFLISSSKVATSKQILDYAIFGFSQINSIWHTTTTIVCQIIFESTPPKIFAKFKNISHAAIVSNTWWASIYFKHTCYYPADFGLNQRPNLIITVLLCLLDQTMSLL
jgi:hypothetical protein